VTVWGGRSYLSLRRKQLLGSGKEGYWLELCAFINGCRSFEEGIMNQEVAANMCTISMYRRLRKFAMIKIHPVFEQGLASFMDCRWR